MQLTKVVHLRPTSIYFHFCNEQSIGLARNTTYCFVLLFSQGHEFFVELLGKLDVISLDYVAPANFIHYVLPVY